MLVAYKTHTNKFSWNFGRLLGGLDHFGGLQKQVLCPFWPVHSAVDKASGQHFTLAALHSRPGPLERFSVGDNEGSLSLKEDVVFQKTHASPGWVPNGGFPLFFKRKFTFQGPMQTPNSVPPF